MKRIVEMLRRTSVDKKTNVDEKTNVIIQNYQSDEYFRRLDLARQEYQRYLGYARNSWNDETANEEDNYITNIENKYKKILSVKYNVMYNEIDSSVFAEEIENLNNQVSDDENIDKIINALNSKKYKNVDKTTNIQIFDYKSKDYSKRLDLASEEFRVRYDQLYDDTFSGDEPEDDNPLWESMTYSYDEKGINSKIGYERLLIAMKHNVMYDEIDRMEVWQKIFSTISSGLDMDI